MTQHFKFPWPRRLAVAVSGGPDSLCLTWWLSRWAEENSVELLALTVDHGLRPQSGQEAQLVVQWLKEWGLECQILSLSLGQASPQKARQARLRALIGLCHQRGIKDLFLAHHQDDLLETVWMRQQQGSGPKGLAGISSLGFYHGIRLCRPLLALRKQELVDTLQQLKQPFITDPSNIHLKYTRSLARKALQEFSWGQREAFLQEIKGHAHRRLEADERIKAMVPLEHGAGYVTFPFSAFQELMLQDQQWLLLHSLMSQSYCAHPCKRALIINLLTQLNQKSCATGGGCLVYKKRGQVYIFREWKRILPQVCLQPYTFWDSRFLVLEKSFQPVLPLGLYKQDCWVQTQARASFPNISAICYPICSPVPSFVSSFGVSTRVST